MGQVINIFTREEIDNKAKPSFSDFIAAKIGSHRWYVVRRRTNNFRGLPYPAGTVLLLPREYNAIEAEYKTL
jgi:hypothetical protein